MEIIDHTQNCKKILIEEILKTNNNIHFFVIYDNKDLIADIINKFKENNFYKLLTLLNHNNYNGYFSQKNRLNLVKTINSNKDIYKFLKDWLLLEVPNEDILNIEIYSLNILLEKIIIKGIKNNILEDLEEIKYSLFTSTEKLKNKFYNFKIKLITRDKVERDIYRTLKSIINGNHNLAIKDLVYIKNYYQDELEMLNYF